MEKEQIEQDSDLDGLEKEKASLSARLNSNTNRSRQDSYSVYGNLVGTQVETIKAPA